MVKYSALLNLCSHVLCFHVLPVFPCPYLFLPVPVFVISSLVSVCVLIMSLFVPSHVSLIIPSVYKSCDFLPLRPVAVVQSTSQGQSWPNGSRISAPAGIVHNWGETLEQGTEPPTLLLLLLLLNVILVLLPCSMFPFVRYNKGYCVWWTPRLLVLYSYGLWHAQKSQFKSLPFKTSQKNSSKRKRYGQIH